jgi:hypothetical protein
MKLGMVVPGIVNNQDHPPTAARTDLPEVLKKRMKRHRVEPFLFPLENQFPITQTNRPKITDTLPSWMVQQYRINILRRHPHPTARSILLKMDFIGRPQVDFWIGYPPSKFFYMPPEGQGWLGQSGIAASVAENQRI